MNLSRSLMANLVVFGTSTEKTRPDRGEGGANYRRPARTRPKDGVYDGALAACEASAAVFHWLKIASISVTPSALFLAMY